MVIVEIYVPALNEKFDFKLPSTGKIKDIITELIRMLEITQGNIHFDSDMPLLCNLDKEQVLNPNLTVAELQITDGTLLQLL